MAILSSVLILFHFFFLYFLSSRFVFSICLTSSLFFSVSFLLSDSFIWLLTSLSAISSTYFFAFLCLLFSRSSTFFFAQCHLLYLLFLLSSFFYILCLISSLYLVFSICPFFFYIGKLVLSDYCILLCLLHPLSSNFYLFWILCILLPYLLSPHLFLPSISHVFCFSCLLMLLPSLSCGF